MMTKPMTELYSPDWSLIPPLFPNVALPFSTTITFLTGLHDDAGDYDDDEYDDNDDDDDDDEYI